MGQMLFALRDEALELPREEPYNIVVFEIGGRIVTRVGTDIPFLKKESFFEMLSPEEREFFLKNCCVSGVKRLLLETTRGVLLVFCGIFMETGLFAAVMFRTPRETLRDFWKSGFWRDLRVSPTLMKNTLPRKRGRDEDLEGIAECYGRLAFPFDYGVRRPSSERDEDLLLLLDMITRNLARSFGCGITLRSFGRAVRGDVWVFSMPAFVAVMSCLLSLCGNVSPDGKANIEIFELDGRYFVTFCATLSYWRDKESKGHSCDYSELRECERIVQRHDLLFDMKLSRKEERADLSVRFSPDFQDISFFGFKHPELTLLNE